MSYELILVTCMAIVTWLTLYAAAIIRTRSWSFDGAKSAFGNRDQLPATTAFSGRADRTAKNTLENFVLFSVLVMVAKLGKVETPNVVLGAEIFFWARIAYIPVYLIGIPYLRTIVWGVSVVGLAIIVEAILACVI